MNKNKEFPIIDAMVNKEILTGVDGGLRREVEKLYSKYRTIVPEKIRAGQVFKKTTKYDNLTIVYAIVADYGRLRPMVLEVCDNHHNPDRQKPSMNMAYDCSPKIHNEPHRIYEGEELMFDSIDDYFKAKFEAAARGQSLLSREAPKKFTED